MKREQKYPDTNTFHYHNANPKNKATTDCVIRAIATGLGIPYNQVVMDLAELQCKTGLDMSEKRLYGKYLESKGWVKMAQPRKADNTKYTGEEFCLHIDRLVPHKGNRVIANIGGHHIVAIMDGKVYDIWNSTDGSIGNYWVER